MILFTTFRWIGRLTIIGMGILVIRLGVMLLINEGFLGQNLIYHLLRPEP
jgi:hypothetical protein